MAACQDVGLQEAHLKPADLKCRHMCIGLGSTGLVLSIAAPFGGNWWYGLTWLAPLAGYYYLQKGDRQEEVCCCSMWMLSSSLRSFGRRPLGSSQ